MKYKQEDTDIWTTATEWGSIHKPLLFIVSSKHQKAKSRCIWLRWYHLFTPLLLLNTTKHKSKNIFFLFFFLINGKIEDNPKYTNLETELKSWKKNISPNTATLFSNIWHGMAEKVKAIKWKMTHLHSEQWQHSKINPSPILWQTGTLLKLSDWPFYCEINK